MSGIKQLVEQKFESLAQFIFTFRWFFVATMLVLAAASVSQLSKIEIDMSDEGFLHPDDRILTTYLDFRDQFGRDDFIVLAVHGDIFKEAFLKKLAKLHRTLENELDHVDEVNSMLNARNTYGVADGIVVEDLLSQWPQTDEHLAALRKRVMENPLYLNRLISEDGRFTTVLVRLDTYESQAQTEEEYLQGFDDDFDNSGDSRVDAANGEQEGIPYLSEDAKNEIVGEVQKIASSFESDDFEISIAGSPVIVATVKKAMRQDMMLFIRLAVLTVGISLFFMFRRLSGVILPLAVVVLSLLSTMAIMAVCGVAIKLPTMILPSFLLAVGVGDSVHILSIFFQRYNRDGDKREAIIYTLGHSGLAIVMTSLTTAGGLLSFITATIAPVFDLGVFASVGVMIALVYSVLFLPALLAVIPLKPATQKVESSNHPVKSLMHWLTDFSTGHAKAVTLVAFTVLLIAAVGLSKVRFSHDILTWLPGKFPVKSATHTIDTELKGSVTLELLVDSGRENGLYQPQILNQIEAFAQALEGTSGYTMFVGKVMAVNDILKEIHLALNEDNKAFYVIPQDEKLIPQEFLLFENSGSDDLQDVIDSRFQVARITIKVPWQDAMNYVPFIKEVEELSDKIFGSDVTITTTGIMTLFGQIIYSSIYSAATSYMIAACVITVMMIFLIGSFRLGLVCMIPNLTPIIITMGIMGWFGISLNMFTMLIGSIAIGLAVDDTIHFVYNFRRYFAKTAEPVSAVRQTLQTAGRAMLTTTIVLSLGFFIFMFASMHNLFHFGMLTGIALLLALAADFLLAPALMVLVAGTRVGSQELLRR